MKRYTRFIAVAVAVGAATLALTACDGPKTSSTDASCAFIVGDGQNGRDSSLHKVLYPQQTFKLNSDNGNTTEKVSYVPCNDRNYITDDGTQKNANGEVIGDQTPPTVAYVKSGVPIKVSTTVAWTLNEDPNALKDFYKLCFKYTCASSDDSGGTTNYSTKGWNGMLGENFAFVVNKLANNAASTLDDKLWQNHDAKEEATMTKEMSANFNDFMRQRIGYSEPLFCGAGTSGWSGGKPGVGTFNCTAVLISVDKIDKGDVSTSGNAAGATTVNDQRLKAAQALYGPYAQYFLGLQDTIGACNSKSACNIYVGSPGSVPAQPVTPAK